MDEPQFVPLEVLAKTFSVSPATIRTWVRNEYIPKSAYIKIGNTYRFNTTAVIAALTALREDKLAEKETEVSSEVAIQNEKARVESPVQLELNFNPDEDL